jgi:hypothetical protein
MAVFVGIKKTERDTRGGIVGRRGEKYNASSTRPFLLFGHVGVGILVVDSINSLLIYRVPKSSMSRGRGGSRGGFAGRASNPPPMGLTFADIQAISREQSALYPVRTLSSSCTFILTRLRNTFPSLMNLFLH